MEKMKTLAVRIEAGEHEKVKELSDKYGVTISAFVRAGMLMVISHSKKTQKEILDLMGQGMDLNSALITIRENK